MDGGAWWATVHGVAKSQTWLTDFTFTFHFHALEKEMATHSSVLAWRIPGMGEPGGLPFMGSYRVRHDWSYLVAAAAGEGHSAHRNSAVQGRCRSRGGPEQVWGHRFSKVGTLAFLQDVGMIWVSGEGDFWIGSWKMFVSRGKKKHSW